mmetsp:Transcript_23499/g.70616  ORF Transcript_23499/g.70616 Transcript_23499/m.70616 type:complete len:199 (-) Transcript_23499:165-761(-)
MTETAREMMNSAGEALSGASGAMSGALGEIKSVNIEQGPMVLRLLAILGGLGSFGCAVFEMIYPLKAIVHPVNYIMYGYITLFSLTTLLFEVKPEWLEKIPAVSGYQDMLIKHCPFLTVLAPRGVFYLFQGTLWLTFAKGFDEILEIVAAAELAFVGVLHILAHTGIMPKQIAQKAKQAVVAAEKAAGVDINRDGVIG